MTEFLLALALFFVGHAVPPRPPVKPWLVDRFGERAYLIGYSILSLALMIWLFWAAFRAPYIGLWTPTAWASWVPVLVMPIALALAAPGFVSPNPMSVALTRGPLNPDRPGIVAITRHPVLWGFGLWAASHVPPNGDLVSVILFGILALFAFAGMSLVERRKKRTIDPARWADMMADTSRLPFAAIMSGRAAFPTDRRTWIAVIIGLAIYILFLWRVHEDLFGVDPLLLLSHS